MAYIGTMHIRGCFTRTVFGSSVVGTGAGILTNYCRGALYVAPTVPGPYHLIEGGEQETQIRNAIKAGPKILQLHDWNHYPTEHLIEEWEKACVTNLFRSRNIYCAIDMSNPCAKIPSSSMEWVKSNVTHRVSTPRG